MADDASLDKTIQDSVDQIDASDEEAKETKDSSKEEETEETEETDEIETEDEESEDGLTDEEKVHAANLYKALKDPQARVPILQYLAQDLIEKVDPATTKEKKAVVATIEETLTKHLGDNYKFLTKGLSAAIKEIVETIVEEKTAGIKSSLVSSEKQKLEEQIDTAMADVFGSYTNVDAKLQKQVLKLMDTVKPSPGTNPKQYFKILVQSAAAELGISLIKRGAKESNNIDTSQRISRNKNDAFSRLASARVASPKGKELSTITQKVSLDDAINASMKNLEKQFK